jgi:hypothetical protein
VGRSIGGIRLWSCVRGWRSEDGGLGVFGGLVLEDGLEVLV